MLSAAMPLVRKIQKRLQQMESSLKSSFSNIRHDITSHKEKLAGMEAKLTEQEKRIEQLTGEIARLQKQDSSAKETSPSESVHKKPEGLTPLHLQILKRLMIFQMEKGMRAVSMRDLAADIYPAKEYNVIKATLSEYVKKLHQKGFIEKFNMEKLYLSYTEKALQYADSQRLSRMKELISQPLGVR